MSETPVLQHYQVELTIQTGSGIVKDWTTWLYDGICIMLNSCTSTQKQADIDLSRGRWHQKMMSRKQCWPDMTHMNWNNTLRSTGINPWNPHMYPYEKGKSHPGHQDLCHTVAQASGIWKTWKLAQCCSLTDF